MNKPQIAWDTVIEHAKTAQILDMTLSVPRFKGTENEFSVLELGPGDSLFSAVISRSLGATNCWLVDAGSFANTNIEAYEELISFLKKQGANFLIEGKLSSLSDLLTACKAHYLTNGIKSLANIPSNSINFCFSNAVLEHIPKDDFHALVDEIRRILKPDGVCIHRVDLRDHLGGGLNNLRFSHERWESPLFRNSGFYTNRIRFAEMVSIFEARGFECGFPRIVRWSDLPLGRNELDVGFRDLPDEDLLVSGFDVVLKCAE